MRAFAARAADKVVDYDVRELANLVWALAKLGKGPASSPEAARLFEAAASSAAPVVFSSAPSAAGRRASATIADAVVGDDANARAAVHRVAARRVRARVASRSVAHGVVGPRSPPRPQPGPPRPPPAPPGPVVGGGWRVAVGGVVLGNGEGRLEGDAGVP